MERYAGSGGSNVAAYEVGETSIAVGFKDGSVYLYTYQSTGPGNVERMKQLARAGQGLNTFISRVVRGAYAQRLR